MGNLLLNGQTAFTQTGTNSPVLSSNVTLENNFNARNAKIVQAGTPVEMVGTTENNLHDVIHTGIPSKAKIVHILLENVSKSSTNTLIIQVGHAGGFVTSGYICRFAFSGAASGAGGSGTPANNAFFEIYGTQGNDAVESGIFSLMNIRDYVWVASYTGGRTDSAYGLFGGGHVDVTAPLTQVKLYAYSDPGFDSGYSNVLWI